MKQKAELMVAAELLVFFSLSCAGELSPAEVGEECWDGKDNDNDGTVDCSDPDCAKMTYCSQPVDWGVDLQLNPDGKFNPAKDSVTSKDSRPKPDTGPASSYGTTCASTTGAPLCPDGKTICLPGPFAGKGFCTEPCTTIYADCRAGPNGTFAACVYHYQDKYFCAFLCQYKNVPHPCPPAFLCYSHPEMPAQKHCWP